MKINLSPDTIGAMRANAVDACDLERIAACDRALAGDELTAAETGVLLGALLEGVADAAAEVARALEKLGATTRKLTAAFKRGPP